MRILVTGATGQVGRHLVSQLHRAGHQVRGLSRTPDRADFPDGVEAVGGNLTDAATLEAAFAGAEGVHLITFDGEGEDLTNGADIVALAERQGVTRATVLGGWGATSVESALRQSKIRWSILQPGEFMGNALELAEEVRTERTVSMLTTYASAVVHEADIAGVAATALTKDGHGGKTYRITGPEALTPRERTRILAQASGQAIDHVQLSEDAERARLVGYGYDPDYVEFGVQLALNPPGDPSVVLSTVEAVTGRPARTFTQWARENAAAFRTG